MTSQVSSDVAIAAGPARGVEREELEAVAALFPEALRAGISQREIARLTGVSRTWLEALTQRDDPDSR